MKQGGAQAVIEYLVVVAVIIAAILAIRSQLGGRAKALMEQAIDGIPTGQGGVY